VATNDVLAQRKIIKVKRHSAADGKVTEETQQNGKGFKLICSLGSTIPASADKPKFSFSSAA